MKLLAALIIIASMVLTSCASYRYLENPRTNKVERVEPYGLFNMDTGKNPEVAYEVSAGTVICSIIFFESIVIPVIGIGYQLFEPVYFTNTNIKGSAI